MDGMQHTCSLCRYSIGRDSLGGGRVQWMSEVELKHEAGDVVAAAALESLLRDAAGCLLGVRNVLGQQYSILTWQVARRQNGSLAPSFLGQRLGQHAHAQRSHLGTGLGDLHSMNRHE
jgi:hypothetical protein